MNGFITYNSVKILVKIFIKGFRTFKLGNGYTKIDKLTIAISNIKA